ncbi:MAG: M23 family metallopeptidase [Defluviitaleaceae bacterium]|nr:M23 family metallopeptidase [Defluviitaleaceae bacterium]MCL2263979.1 M23 family metallopeptidase [Defluviitaleaceae bacterium]
MFFRRKEPQTRPTVKKASDFINTKSHNQKKYISLMLVPSYSTGKTRSLRIPRAVLYGVALGMFMVFSVVMGFYLNSHYQQRVARNLSRSLDETQAAFHAYRYESEQAQNELIDATVQMYEQLSEEQMRARIEIDRQERRHQDTLGDIWDIIDGLEDQIREFEEERQEIIGNLSSRRIIPPIANLLSEMEKTQENLREALLQEVVITRPDVPSIGLLGFGLQAVAVSEDEVLDRLNILVAELEAQRQMLDSLEEYKEQMQPYLLNFPTIWPVRGQISSGFGWRRNPFGGRGSEFHAGVDIPARTGTPIRAAGGGTVTFEGWQNGYGNTVVIDHGSGITTKYAHNTRNAVTVGQRVERGQIIAYVGSTGRSTGPHVHYEVRRNGTAVNPVSFLLEMYN